jgi:hypothetical protein
LDDERGLFAKRREASTVFVLAPSAAEKLPISADHYRTEFSRKSDQEAGSAGLETDWESPGDLPEIDPLEGIEFP